MRKNIPKVHFLTPTKNMTESKSYIGAMAQDPDSNDARLSIKIDNSVPIALDDFTQSMNGWEKEFVAYANRTEDAITTRRCKLFVKEVRQGSTIIDLVQQSIQHGMPFVENVSTILGFAETMKSAITKYLLNGDDKSKPAYFTNTDLRNIGQILQPIAADSASQLIVSTVVNNVTEQHFHLGYGDANAVQNVVRRLGAIPTPQEESERTHSKMLLYWHQMNKSLKNNSTNLGHIDDLARGAKNIVFDDEEIKKAMIHNNPFDKLFVVDVKILTAQGDKVVAYKVMKLHEAIEKLPDDEAP